MEKPRLKNRPWNDWIAEYGLAHQHPVNRVCHTLGIPLVTLSLLGLPLGLLWQPLWLICGVLFTAGWLLQFIGHAFEGKPPEFFKDWRFLLVGLSWWWGKLRGKY